MVGGWARLSLALVGCAALGSTSLMVGCASTRATSLPARSGATGADPEQRGPKLQLDGVAILAVEDPLLATREVEPAALYAAGVDAEVSADLTRAAAFYRRVLELFPDGYWGLATRFRYGLLLETHTGFAAAAVVYEPAAAMPLPPAGLGPGEQTSAHALGPQGEGEVVYVRGLLSAERLWADIHYRLAVCYSKMDRSRDAVRLFERLLAVPGLGSFDRLEAWVGKGVVLQDSGQLAAAEGALLRALRVARQARQESNSFPDRGLVAEASFRLGEIAMSRFETIRLAFPAERLKTELERKCEALLLSQNRYLRAIRHGDAHTAAAAGYRIGSMYETLHAELVELEVPQELTEAQQSVYRSEVRERVGVLVEKAIRIYEKTLLVGRRAPTAGAWVARMERALERLRMIYLGDE